VPCIKFSGVALHDVTFWLSARHHHHHHHHHHYSEDHIVDHNPYKLFLGEEKTQKIISRRVFQWDANYGYCGEVSLISAGLYYGQYISQYDARALASPNVPQIKRGASF